MSNDLEKKWREKILAYALKNAIEHDGKALTNNVLNSLFHEGLDKNEVKNIIPLIQRTLKEINSLAIEEQQKRFSSLENEVDHREERVGLQELPNVTGKVVLRLAPYPSGALHIGNAKTYLLNALYAEKCQGKLYLIIDDTIGSEEKQIVKEAYKLIPEAFDWLKVKYEKPIIYKSDRLALYYEYAEKLIALGKAYVCECSAKKLRDNRTKGLECKDRGNSIEKNLEEWKKMLSKGKAQYKEGQAVLRIKTSMQHENPAFRDRVLFRISERVHLRVGKKYRVWPLLEFSWAIDDHLLGITHIVRGKDLMMESEMEKYIWNIFSWRAPELLHAGMINFEGEKKISKSKAQKEVLSGKFSSWSDPRTWSIQSLMLRGIQPEALRKFVEDIGLNQKDTNVAVEILYSINRKLLHEIALRFNFQKARTNEKSNVEILMPDASIVKGNSNIASKLKDGSIIHFTGFGYCKYNKKEKRFWFAHA